MKILVLTKRQTTNNDIIDSKFGRSWEFPNELSKLSNDVCVFCLSYKNKEEGPLLLDKDPEKNAISWISMNAGKIKPLGFLIYSFKAYRLAKRIKPDAVFAMSDSIYAILGSWIAKTLNCLIYIDLQDNYEAYDSYKIPFVPQFFKKAVLKSDIVLCVSSLLQDYIAANYSNTINSLVVENGISNEKFYPISQSFCRKKLNLPSDVIIIGICGSLYKDKGIKIIFDGFEKLKNTYERLHLAIAGERNFDIPEDKRIHDFGVLDHNEVKYFINALDTAIICNKESLQYTYGYPVKAFEAIACHIPLVVSKVGPLMKYFDLCPECFFDTDEIDSFCAAIEYQMVNHRTFDIKVNTWKDLSGEIDNSLKNLHGGLNWL